MQQKEWKCLGDKLIQKDDINTTIYILNDFIETCSNKYLVEIKQKKNNKDKIRYKNVFDENSYKWTKGNMTGKSNW